MRLTLALLLLSLALFVCVLLAPVSNAAGIPPAPTAACAQLKATAQEGDVVFLEIDNFLFRSVAETTSSWTSHVGVVLSDNGRLAIFESAVLYSRVTDLCAFIGRSMKERFALIRPHNPLREEELVKMRAAAKARLGILYDTGFDLDSKNQFCSKFVYDVYKSAGRTIGKIETFRDLFNALPPGTQRDSLEGFWRRWFYAGMRFSGIPWERRTVTPASLLMDRNFDLILGKRAI